MPCKLCDLEPRQCHWPLPGPEGADQLFCGARTPSEGVPYCVEHMALAWPSRRPEARKARRMAQIKAALFRHRLREVAVADVVDKSANLPVSRERASAEAPSGIPQICEDTLRPVAALALGEIEAELISTDPPTIEWVAPTDLLVDEAYQRGLSEKSKDLIRKIAGKWDWRRFKPPIIAWTERGFEIVDGQHTAIGAACRGIDRIPVMVIEAADVQDRASAFIGQNKDRLVVTAMQLHHAAVAAGEDDAVTVEQVCARAGVTLVRGVWGGYRWKPGDSVAIDAIRRLVSQRGAMRARQVLEVLVQAGCAPVAANQIKAADMLLSTAQYAEQLEPYPQNVADLASAVKAWGEGAEKEAKLFAKANCVPLWKALAATWFTKTKKRRKAA